MTVYFVDKDTTTKKTSMWEACLGRTLVPYILNHRKQVAKSCSRISYENNNSQIWRENK